MVKNAQVVVLAGSLLGSVLCAGVAFAKTGAGLGSQAGRARTSAIAGKGVCKESVASGARKTAALLVDPDRHWHIAHAVGRRELVLLVDKARVRRGLFWRSNGPRSNHEGVESPLAADPAPVGGYDPARQRSQRCLARWRSSRSSCL